MYETAFHSDTGMEPVSKFGGVEPFQFKDSDYKKLRAGPVNKLLSRKEKGARLIGKQSKRTRRTMCPIAH